MTDLQQLKDNFNVVEYLEDQGIEYHTEGKNVTQGWVNITCPFPYCGDPSWHLGIHHEEGNYFSCWVCGESGDIIKLIMELEQINFKKAEVRLKQYQGLIRREERPRERKIYRSILPEGFELIEEGREPELVKYFFGERGFDLSICQHYGLGWVPFGEYQLRLIVPVYYRNGGYASGEYLVSFQAVDMTGQARGKYLDCPPGRATVENKNLLYGMERVKGDQIILVEGVTDKWRIGMDAVALFTKNWTRQQINLLYERARHKRLKVLLDLDAIRDGGRLAKELSTLWPEVVFVELEEGDPKDPAEFGDELVKRVLEE